VHKKATKKNSYKPSLVALNPSFISLRFLYYKKFFSVCKVFLEIFHNSRNSSAFGFLLQASSHAKPLRGGLMHLNHYVISRTLQ